MNHRRDKVGCLIANFCARLFLEKADDPRLRPITVTRAEISADLSSAKVFYSVFGGEAELASAKLALSKAKSFVRYHIGQHLDLRRTPTLAFVYDRNPSYAQKVFDILGAEGFLPQAELTSTESLQEGSSREESLADMTEAAFEAPGGEADHDLS
jgi:ribosome-binding factor A